MGGQKGSHLAQMRFFPLFIGFWVGVTRAKWVLFGNFPLVSMPAYAWAFSVVFPVLPCDSWSQVLGHISCKYRGSDTKRTVVDKTVCCVNLIPQITVKPGFGFILKAAHSVPLCLSVYPPCVRKD